MHRPISKWSFALMLVMASTLCSAQIYKCPQADGTVVFSDKACAEDAQVVQGLERNSSGLGHSSSGPPSSLTMGNGSVLEFKRMLEIQVQTETGFRTAKGGLYVFHEGADREIAFEDIESLYVTSWSRDYCGNLSHLCRPRVRIVTAERTINTQYKALRSIKVLIDDELDGREKELLLFFGNENRPHIRVIRF